MRIMILGSGQDAGIPHIGCYCDVCDRASKNAEYKRMGPSIAILDDENGQCHLIDASPDFKYQLDMLRHEVHEIGRKGKIPVSDILLTHAHLGHCAGLWRLGNEALDEKRLPVFCTSKMAMFLNNNHPFSLLVKRENIEIREIRPDEGFELDGLQLVTIQVPHRNEVADTVGYMIANTEGKVLYIPDVDHWTEEIIEKIKIVDIAVIDGTFYSRDESPRFDEIPHPPIQETMELLGDTDTKIYFTHINHTNPVNRDGNERKSVESRGFKIAYDGMILRI